MNIESKRIGKPVHISIPLKRVLADVQEKYKCRQTHCICFGTDTGPCDWCLEAEEQAEQL